MPRFTSTGGWDSVAGSLVGTLDDLIEVECVDSAFFGSDLALLNVSLSGNG
jgi:hypothetical protein